MGAKVKKMWETVPLKKSYEAVIIGGGVHGLAAAYYLARDHSITDVAVVPPWEEGI